MPSSGPGLQLHYCGRQWAPGNIFTLDVEMSVLEAISDNQCAEWKKYKIKKSVNLYSTHTESCFSCTMHDCSAALFEVMNQTTLCFI